MMMRADKIKVKEETIFIRYHLRFRKLRKRRIVV